jgi:hypothetical protein
MTKTLFPAFDNAITAPKKMTILLPMPNGDKMRLDDAVQLGHNSSKRTSHYKHTTQFAPLGNRCSACRWFEVSLYRTPTSYVIWSCGHTIVDGETSRITIHETDNEFTIIEHLTVRKGSTVFLPQPSALVLAQASKYDDGIQDAYINRVVP